MDENCTTYRNREAREVNSLSSWVSVMTWHPWQGVHGSQLEDLLNTQPVEGPLSQHFMPVDGLMLHHDQEDEALDF